MTSWSPPSKRWSANVDSLDAVIPVLQQLGRDHRRFGAVTGHYPAVGASLLATLQYSLGPLWTEQLAADSAEAYGLDAKVMAQAAESFAMDIPQRPRPWRCYSLANAPRQDGTLELHIQLVPGRSA